MKKLIFILFASFSAMAQLPTTGLVGYYPFVGNANDLSGNVLNGTVVGATLTNDRFGNLNSAYSFNGVGDYIFLPPGTFTVMNNYSYSFWMKPTVAPVSAGTFPFCAGTTGSTNCQAITYQNATNVFGSGYNTGVPVQSAVQSPPMAPNQWIHVVVTRDNSAIRMYINGGLIAATSLSLTGSNASYGTGTASVVIGARSTFAPGSFFTGLIDELRIYNLVLNQSQVTALYNEVCFQNISVSVMPSPFCAGTTLSMTATGTGTYLTNWYTSPSSPVSSGSGNTFTFVPWLMNPVPSVFTFYTDAGLCGAYPRSVVNVTVNPLPVLTVTNNGPFCPGIPAQLTASGASTYTWNTGLSGAVLTVSPNITTTYTVIGTASTGCSNSKSPTLAVLPAPNTNITASPDFTLCVGSSVTLWLTGAPSCLWSTGGTNFSISVSPTTGTSYSAVGTSANSCTNSASIFIIVLPVPALQVSSSSASICSGSNATLTASGAMNYSWSPNATTFSLMPTVVVSPTVTSTYTAIGSNSLGCVNTKTIALVVANCEGVGLYNLDLVSAEFVIAPNPASGLFSVKYQLNGSENALVKIRDLQGKEIFVIPCQPYENQLSISADELEAGIYFCTLSFDAKDIATKKLVITH